MTIQGMSYAQTLSSGFEQIFKPTVIASYSYDGSDPVTVMILQLRIPISICKSSSNLLMRESQCEREL